MESIIKIGGSLAKDPKSLKMLCGFLPKVVGEHGILIVPGGAEFADKVREYDRMYNLSARTSHRMAIFAMNQYGMLLADLIQNSKIVQNLDEAKCSISDKKVTIILPAKLVISKNSLENSWDITSDSIAAWIAEISKAKRLVLITDVDGIFPKNPKEYQEEKPFEKILARDLLKEESKTCVDKNLPKLLLKSGVKCYVVNGNHPERIRKILNGKKTVCTEIIT